MVQLTKMQKKDLNYIAQTIRIRRAIPPCGKLGTPWG